MSAVESLHVAISIDTEADHDARWARSRPLAFDSILRGVPERLQPAFRASGAVPTYLLAVEALEHDGCVAVLRGLEGEHELGTHLHAAFVEPHKKYRDYAGVYSTDFQSSYPPEIEHAKLATLSDLFERRFGYRATSFRAGRFGAGASTIDSLERLGYRVDTSVTPRLRWFEPNGEVDFRRAPEQPYFPAEGAIGRAGPWREERLLEVPVTVRPRLLRRTPAWFRPWFSSVDDMKRIVRHQLHRHAGRRRLCLNMMFHSMEVTAGASPYPQCDDEVKRFIDDMVAVLEWCAGEGAGFEGLSSLGALYTADATRDDAGGDAAESR